MLNFLFKSGFLVFISIWIRPRIKGLLFTLFIIIVTWLIHREYIAYLQLIGNFTSAGLSYFVKWTVIILTTLSYYYFVETKNNKDAPRHSVGLDIDIAKKNAIAQKKEDGFDFIRAKKDLKTSSQRILNE